MVTFLFFSIRIFCYSENSWNGVTRGGAGWWIGSGQIVAKGTGSKVDLQSSMSFICKLGSWHKKAAIQLNNLLDKYGNENVVN